MGPDHPQKEIYDESKHGINYYAHMDDMNLDSLRWVLGEEYTQAPNCVTCHMGAAKNIEATHDMGSRLSWNLRAPISKRMEDYEKKRATMQKVCLNCHGPEWVNNFYSQFDGSVTLFNDVFARPAAEIMKRLRAQGELSKTPFDEEIEWVYFELWHHEGRRARHGAAMMGPDYVQWHGFYEVAHTFYFKLLPLARELGESAFIDELLAQPEHSWIDGVKPKSIVMQEKAFKQWQKARQ